MRPPTISRVRGGLDARADGPVRRTRTALCVGVVAGALVLPGCGLVGADDPARGGAASTAVGEAGPSDPAVRAATATQVLDARARALLDRDREAFLATLDPQSTAFRRRQADVFDALAQVPLAGWSYELLGEGPALPAGREREVGPDAWVAHVQLSYRLAGVDLGAVHREQYLTLVRRGGAWVLADDADGPTARDLWDLGPVSVVRGRRTLVLGTAATSVLQRQAALGDAAATRVDAVWGTAWPRRTVLLVPRDQTEMAALLGREDQTGLGQIAAVTTGDALGETSGPATDRVLVNPAGFARLQDVGRRVVLAHEMTHVAVRSRASAAAPTWLSEGFADYVAYTGEAALTPSVLAADLLAEVRAGRGPTRLPDDAAFDATGGDVTPAYSAAWIAVRLVAERYGRDRLVALYGEVTGRAGRQGEDLRTPVPLEEALPAVLGVDLATFERQWRDELARLARAGG